MKLFFAIAVLSLFTVSAHAALPPVPHAALCELNADPDSIKQPELEQTDKIDVLHVASVSPAFLSFINQHLKTEEYITADLDLAGIQAFFTKEEPYNELYVISYVVKSSGATFTAVTSYPGDNEYGLYFDAIGNEVAQAHDGDISLNVGSDSVACWSALQESN